jgi:hypothetical protein
MKATAFLKGWKWLKLESIIDAYREACKPDSNYRYVKQPILSVTSEIWMQPEKQFGEEDYLYEDDLITT